MTGMVASVRRPPAGNSLRPRGESRRERLSGAERAALRCLEILEAGQALSVWRQRALTACFRVCRDALCGAVREPGAARRVRALAGALWRCALALHACAVVCDHAERAALCRALRPGSSDPARRGP